MSVLNSLKLLDLASTCKIIIRFKNPHTFKEQLLVLNLLNIRNNKDFALFKEKA